jgi:hypothetical protein
MDGRLPDSVAWRVGKAMLTPTFERAFELHDRERLADLARNPGWMADYLDMDAFRRFASKERTLTEKEETMLAWVATAMIWLNGQWPSGPEGPSIYGQRG